MLERQSLQQMVLGKLDSHLSAVSVMPSVGVMPGSGGNYEENKRVRGCRREAEKEL